MEQEHSIRVIVADDHAAVRIGVAHTLVETGLVSIVGAAGNPDELMVQLREQPCDVLVLDYAMPGGRHLDGMVLLRMIRQHFPIVRVVLLTMMDHPGIIEAVVHCGVNCIVSKADELHHIVAAVKLAHWGGASWSPKIQDVLKKQRKLRLDVGPRRELSPRETEVLRLYASGMTIDQIAATVHRSKKTISAQKASAMKRLGIELDRDLLIYAIESGLVSRPEPASLKLSDT